MIIPLHVLISSLQKLSDEMREAWFASKEDRGSFRTTLLVLCQNRLPRCKRPFQWHNNYIDLFVWRRKILSIDPSLKSIMPRIDWIIQRCWKKDRDYYMTIVSVGTIMSGRQAWLFWLRSLSWAFQSTASNKGVFSDRQSLECVWCASNELQMDLLLYFARNKRTNDTRRARETENNDDGRCLERFGSSPCRVFRIGSDISARMKRETEEERWILCRLSWHTVLCFSSVPSSPWSMFDSSSTIYRGDSCNVVWNMLKNSVPLNSSHLKSTISYRSRSNRACVWRSSLPSSPVKPWGNCWTCPPANKHRNILKRVDRWSSVNYWVGLLFRPSTVGIINDETAGETSFHRLLRNHVHLVNEGEAWWSSFPSVQCLLDSVFQDRIEEQLVHHGSERSKSCNVNSIPFSSLTRQL